MRLLMGVMAMVIAMVGCASGKQAVRQEPATRVGVDAGTTDQVKAAVPPVDATNTSAFGSTSPAGGGFAGAIYFLPEDTEQLPDFASLKPIGTIYTDRFDVPLQDFEKGFPGVTDRFEWFAIRYEGTFNLARGGFYLWALASDDGARLFIDGNLVVDNDGVHPFDRGENSVELAAGTHTLVLEYFQGPATELGLQLFVVPPDGDTERIFTR